MPITISNKQDFINSFLTPISKIANSAVISTKGNLFTSTLSTPDNTILVNLSYTNGVDVGDHNLNIPDISKLMRVLSVIDTQDISLNIDTNSISYTSEVSRFKFHLYEEGIISTPKVTFEKLNQIKFDGTFTIEHSTLLNLIKGSTIATDSNKIYLTFNKNTIFSDLTDKSRPNVDSYGMKLSENYTGPQLSIPTALSFETFRILASMKFKELKCSFCSSKSIFVLEATPNNCLIKFVVSALSN